MKSVRGFTFLLSLACASLGPLATAQPVYVVLPPAPVRVPNLDLTVHQPPPIDPLATAAAIANIQNSRAQAALADAQAAVARRAAQTPAPQARQPSAETAQTSNVPPGTVTMNHRNGRFWRYLTDNHLQIPWIMGFVDASKTWRDEVVAAQKDHPEIQTVVADMPPFGLSNGEIAESLTLFYSEPANRPIPIVYALVWVHLKATGAAESALSDLAVHLRKSFSDPALLSDQTSLH